MVQQQNPVRGFLMSLDLRPEILVKFQYNPTQLSDKRAVTYTALNAPGLLMPVRQYSQGGDRTLSFTVRIDGLFAGPAADEYAIAVDDMGGIEPELNKYRAFLYPKTTRWEEAGGSFQDVFEELQQFQHPPRCLFGFGERVIECVVTEIGITETLFNAQLAPVRADISITLIETARYGNEPVSGLAIV